MNLKFHTIKTIFLVILFSMVTDVDQAAIEVENKRIHKEKFYEKIEQLINEKEKKKKTFTFIKIDEYLVLIETITTTKNKKEKKTPKEYNMLRDYDVITIGQTQKIIKKRDNPDEPIRYLVPFEDLFETIHCIHHQVGHKCRDFLLPHSKKGHLNLTVDMINSMYLFVLL
jgi:hypothetical protein